MKSSDGAAVVTMRGRVAPYVVSLAATPALFTGAGAVTNVASTAVVDLRPVYRDGALSAFGRALDEELRQRRVALEGVGRRDTSPYFEDVVLALRGRAVRQHSARVVRRDRRVQMPEQADDYEHLL